MPNPIQKKRYRKRFAAIESSFRIEGMDPSGDVIYRRAKAQVLMGSLTPREALAYVVEQSASTRRERIAVGA
jgi:hypothetical protein